MGTWSARPSSPSRSSPRGHPTARGGGVLLAPDLRRRLGITRVTLRAKIRRYGLASAASS